MLRGILQIGDSTLVWGVVHFKRVTGQKVIRYGCLETCVSGFPGPYLAFLSPIMPASYNVKQPYYGPPVKILVKVLFVFLAQIIRLWVMTHYGGGVS